MSDRPTTPDTPEASSRKRRRKSPVNTLPPLRGRRIFSERHWRAIQRSLDLSKREYQILQEMFDDCSKDQIARALKLSPHTVHSYLARLYQKLGVRNRASALRRVFETYLSIYPRTSSDVELLRDLFDQPGQTDGTGQLKRTASESATTATASTSGR